MSSQVKISSRFFEIYIRDKILEWDTFKTLRVEDKYELFFDLNKT